MKKIILYSLLIGSIAFSGCEDMLEKEPIHQLSASGFFNSENDLIIYTNSFYANGLPSVDDIAKADGTSDLAAVTIPTTFLTSDWRSTDQGGWSVSSWSPLRNINYFLERAGKTPVSEEVLNHYIGLARFWRALFYFDKVQTFGAVPWYEKAMNPDDPELEKGRDSREFVMGKVLEDITFAATHIRENKDIYSSTINRFTALALKSRICLFEGTYRKYHTGLGLADATTWLQEAAAAAKEVMDKGGYSLYTTGKPERDYRTLFISENLAGMSAISREIILARNMNTDSRVWHSLTWNFNSATNGSRWSLLRPFVNTYLMRDGSRFTDKANFDQIEFLNEMRGRDYRLAQTVRTEGYVRSNGAAAPPDYSVTLTGYHIMKWSLDDTSHDGQGFSTNNVPIIRYAEVLLNYAEAKAELGQFGPAEWSQTIKLLRDRAGVSSVEPATADAYLQSTFFPDVTNKYLLEIRRERGIELCFEGFRYQDLMRWRHGELLSSDKMPFKGVYIPAKNVNYDMDGDGKADMSVVDKIPAPPVAGIKYVVLGSNIKLSEGTKGHLIWAWGVNRKWEDKMYLRPIPEVAITLNRNLLPQNPGWE